MPHLEFRNICPTSLLWMILCLSFQYWNILSEQIDCFKEMRQRYVNSIQFNFRKGGEKFTSKPENSFLISKWFTIDRNKYFDEIKDGEHVILFLFFYHITSKKITRLRPCKPILRQRRRWINLHKWTNENPVNSFLISIANVWMRANLSIASFHKQFIIVLHFSDNTVYILKFPTVNTYL